MTRPAQPLRQAAHPGTVSGGVGQKDSGHFGAGGRGLLTCRAAQVSELYEYQGKCYAPVSSPNHRPSRSGSEQGGPLSHAVDGKTGARRLHS